jgi:hypothetical protein
MQAFHERFSEPVITMAVQMKTPSRERYGGQDGAAGRVSSFREMSGGQNG